MVIVGVILLVIGAVALVDMGATSHGTTDVHLLGWHLGTAGPGRVLLLGTAIGVVLTLGAMSVLSGQLRSRRKRRERDRTIKGTRAENKRLAAQLEEQQAVVVPAAETPDRERHHLRHDHRTRDAVASDDVSTGSVDAYPAEAYPADSDYVVGSRYPQATSVASTPPAPPEGRRG